MQNTYKFQVFVTESSKFGDPVGLVIDEGRHIDLRERLRVTSEIGYVETAFVNSLATNDISIYHAQGEVDFAGSVLIGVSWQLAQLKGKPTQRLLCKRGQIEIWQEGDVYWLRAGLKNNIGNWDYEQLDIPGDVDKIDVADTGGWKKMVWAWASESQGLIRARTFADRIGAPEVQGNGSGSMNLAGQLQREIIITHGEGSVIYARPASSNSAELGGRIIAI